jgi:hypothetical protein
MKILTAEEVKELQLRSNGREMWVTAKLRELKVGEALVLDRKEWLARYPPSRVAGALEKRSKLRFRTGRLLDNSGWLFERIL